MQVLLEIKQLWALSLPAGRVNATLLLSSPLRVASSVFRRAKREPVGSPCGNLVSKTATPWRPALEAPHWVRWDDCVISVYFVTCFLDNIVRLYIRRQERNAFYHWRPKIHRLLFLWHPAWLLWSWSIKGERKWTTFRMSETLNAAY